MTNIISNSFVYDNNSTNALLSNGYFEYEIINGLIKENMHNNNFFPKVFLSLVDIRSNIKRKNTNLCKLTKFNSYRENWNGEGAISISNKTINNTKKIIISVDKQPEIFPLANGGIQIEYENNDRYLEFSVCNDELSIFYKGKHEKELFINTSIDYNLMIELINIFYERSDRE